MSLIAESLFAENHREEPTRAEHDDPASECDCPEARMPCACGIAHTTPRAVHWRGGHWHPNCRLSRLAREDGARKDAARRAVAVARAACGVLSALPNCHACGKPAARGLQTAYGCDAHPVFARGGARVRLPELRYAGALRTLLAALQAYSDGDPR